MIGRIIKNSALHTKLAARQRFRLTAEDYKVMSGLRSVPEIAEYLSQTQAYKGVFSGIEAHLIHRGELEERLKLNVGNEIYSIVPYMSINMKSFFKILDIKDEVEGIKLCARRLCSGSGAHFEERYMRRYSVLAAEVNFNRLSKAESFDEFIDILCETRYKDIFMSLKSDKTRQSLFDIETVLDMYYTRTLKKYIKKYVKGKDNKILNRLYGTEIDLVNISAVIRAKRYYKLQEEEIYAILLRGGHRLRPKDIIRIVKAADENTLKTEIVNTPYAEIFEHTGNFFEERINKYIFDMHRKLLKTEPYSNAAVVSYIYLKEFEIKNIIKIIECVRYGLPQREIEKYIINV